MSLNQVGERLLQRLVLRLVVELASGREGGRGGGKVSQKEKKRWREGGRVLDRNQSSCSVLIRFIPTLPVTYPPSDITPPTKAHQQTLLHSTLPRPCS